MTVSCPRLHIMLMILSFLAQVFPNLGNLVPAKLYEEDNLWANNIKMGEILDL